MATTRRATRPGAATCSTGRGTVTAATTGVFRDLPTTWASRIGEPEGVTSPEELLAAAHASCFSMACSNMLAKAGTPPTALDGLGRRHGRQARAPAGPSCRPRSPSAATSRARPRSRSRTAAEAAKDGCPISRALKGNVELSVEATLEG